MPDFIIFRNAFGSTQGQANYNPDADLNSDGAVDGTDFDVFRQFFGKPPGEE